jgi:transcriptional regulator with XRE-family HTH domain
MAQVNKEIGERIRGIRELSDLSVAALAKRVHTTPEQLTLYESGETDIPVSILHDISTELSIGMTELLTGETAKLSTYSVVRADRGIGVDRREAYNYKALAYHFAGRQMDPYLITIEPKPEGTPVSLNVHGGQEFHYCLEGSFLLQIDKHEIVINPGDAVYFNSQSPHGMRALNNKCAKELVIII